MRKLILMTMLILGLATLSTVFGQEGKIERKDLPAAVEKTVARESKGATIKGFGVEKEDGKTTYEVEMMVDGRSKDLSIDADGNVLSIEEEVSMDSLSADVKAGLTKAAGAGTMGKIESLTKGGKLVAYETVVTTGKKHSEIQVGPDGKKLSHEQ